MRTQIVGTLGDADDGAIKVSLFRGDQDRICGWMIGPISLVSGGVSMPYLPRSSAALAAVAVYCGVEVARCSRKDLFVVDPEGLWPEIWGRSDQPVDF